MSAFFRCCFLCGLTALGCAWCGWGFPVHRHVNRSAVYALPEPLQGWMVAEVDWLSAHATDADKRKHAVEREAPRHYLDWDAPALSCLDTLGTAPSYSRALNACTEDSLWEYGVLPWQLEWSHRKLVEAFDCKDRDGILRAASDLGHYVADAHVPLHTTLNYDGQLTGQAGIHSVWETRLPELFGGGYMLLVEEVEYITDIRSWAWSVVKESHALVAPLLLAERNASNGGRDHMHVRQERGGSMQLLRSESWCADYHEALEGMVEMRWRASIRSVAALWYTAWVDAGSPDLAGVLGPTRRRWQWPDEWNDRGVGQGIGQAPVP